MPYGGCVGLHGERSIKRGVVRQRILPAAQQTRGLRVAFDKTPAARANQRNALRRFVHQRLVALLAVTQCLADGSALLQFGVQRLVLLLQPGKQLR